jgi:hypothetical protein
LKAREKDLGDAVDVLTGEGRMVRNGDQSIRDRFRHGAVVSISKRPAFLYHITIDHGRIHELLPHSGHHGRAFLSVSQQNWKEMIVISCPGPLLWKNDIFGGGEPRQESQTVGPLELHSPRKS